MDDLQSELQELKGFISDLKADRAAQRDKEGRESWTRLTSLSIVVIAVLAAVATQWAGKYSSRVLVCLNDATHNQAKASDQWSYYQAKSIKQNLYEAAAEQAPKAEGGSAEEATRRSEAIKAKVARYETEKEQIQAEARVLEQERDLARGRARAAGERGGRMGLAVSIFQISIALASICLVTKKKPLWYCSMLLAVWGTLEMVRVWLA
jgi:hypothetical protein